MASELEGGVKIPLVPQSSRCNLNPLTYAMSTYGRIEQGEIPQGEKPEEAHRSPMESESFPRPGFSYSGKRNTPS